MILISGASGGIGKFLTNKFVDAGEQVEALYHTHFEASGIGSKTGPGFAVFHKVDLREPMEIYRFVEGMQNGLKNITFIHCAGLNLRPCGKTSWPSTLRQLLSCPNSCYR